jgi:FkbM family methyltransferase
MTTIAYWKNRTKEIVRAVAPTHWRFERAARLFAAEGEREVKVLSQLVERGTVALDVGANMGGYTYALCEHVGADGRVIAVEPVPHLAKLIERATRRLRLPVTVLNCALSSEEGTAELHVPMEDGAEKPAFASLESDKHDGAGRTLRVPLRRLDDVCRNVGSRISFIKIDVEGHELAVLRGGVDTLRRLKPNLLIEVEQRHSRVPIANTFSFLASIGYRGEFLDASGQTRPLEQFDPNAHQRPERAGTHDYVANFVFRPGDESAGER